MFKTLATSVAIMPLIWFNVMPTGAEFCQSGVSFRPARDQWQTNVEAAKVATAQFCTMVTRNPQ